MTPSNAQVSKSIIAADLDPAASQILIDNISAKTIQGGLGPTTAEELDAEFVTLYCLIIDETGSMARNRDAVIKAHAELVKALKGSKKANSILMSVWAFNTGGTRLIHSYLPLDLVPPLTDYNPDNMTNLYDVVIDAVTSLVQYEDALKKAGTSDQAIISVHTDGEDNESRRTAADVKTVVESLLKKEKYIFSLTAFGGDFAKTVAAEMGFPNVLEAGSTPHDIRIAMGTESQSVIRASQTVIGKASQSGFFTK